jgi:DNA-binding protein H-NS
MPLSPEKIVAVTRVAALMAELGVTWHDLGVEPIRKAVAKRKVKFRDESGNTWAGVGQRPRWLVARMHAGATLEQFRVKP